MKTKIIAVVLMLSLVMSGCAFLQASKNLLCDPTEAQVNAAKTAAAFLDLAAGFVGLSEVQVAITLAIIIFNRVRPGLCVALDELEQAIKTVDQVDAVLAGDEAVQKAIRTGQPRPVAPDLTALRAASRK